MALTEVSCNKIFGGLQKVVKHSSAVLGCDMNFAVYLPPQASSQKVPVVYWLSGLTCTEQNFITKSGFQRAAAELGLCVVAPDTSPRGLGLPGEDDSYDFGSGAGFYVNATQEPWAKNYKMYDYVVKELPALVNANFPVLADKAGITGHSMGGHGALTIFLKNQTMFKSCSAFAPICNPMNCPWGEKALGGYLGSDRESWKAYDATELVKLYPSKTEILVDQGSADNFLSGGQLLPQNLQAAAAAAGQPLTYRCQADYDHSYYFIATFIAEHLAFHAKHLK